MPRNLTRPSVSIIQLLPLCQSAHLTNPISRFSQFLSPRIIFFHRFSATPLFKGRESVLDNGWIRGGEARRGEACIHIMGRARILHGSGYTKPRRIAQNRRADYGLYTVCGIWGMYRIMDLRASVRARAQARTRLRKPGRSHLGNPGGGWFGSRVSSKNRNREDRSWLFSALELLLSGTIFRVVGIFLDGSNLEFFSTLVIILNRIDIEFFIIIRFSVDLRLEKKMLIHRVNVSLIFLISWFCSSLVVSLSLTKKLFMQSFEPVNF